MDARRRNEHQPPSTESSRAPLNRGLSRTTNTNYCSTPTSRFPGMHLSLGHACNYEMMMDGDDDGDG